jgi:hypothetical protein
MFGLGTNRYNRGRVRNDTFGPSRIRNAMLAGAGMLAWRWWKNRQASGSQQTNNPNRSFSEGTTRGADTY